MITFATAAFGVSAIVFGGLSWALDGAAAPAAAVLRVQEPMARKGARWRAVPVPPRICRPGKFGFATCASPIRQRRTTPCWTASISSFQRHRRWPSWARTAAGKTTLAKLLCRLYDPQEGAIEVDGVDVRELDIGGWRERVAAVFQAQDVQRRSFSMWHMLCCCCIAPLTCDQTNLLRHYQQMWGPNLDAVLGKTCAAGALRSRRTTLAACRPRNSVADDECRRSGGEKVAMQSLRQLRGFAPNRKAHTKQKLGEAKNQRRTPWAF